MEKMNLMLELRLIASQRQALQKIYATLNRSKFAEELNKKINELMTEFADVEVRIQDEYNSNN